MDYRNENIDKLEIWIDAFLDKLDLNEIHIKEKYMHCYRTSNIAKRLYPDNRLLQVAMKFHDIGRFIQFDKIQTFDDTILSHYIVGKEYIEEMEKEDKIEKSQELNSIKNVIRYHNGIDFIPKEDLASIDEDTLFLIHLSTMIDGIDNGCIGAANYIENEIINDEKHYKEKNPDLDMTRVSSDVLDYFLVDERFDKIKYCKTYADYLLYAVILLIEALKNTNHRYEIRKIIENENTINKYIDLMDKYIEPSTSHTCILHLKRIYDTTIKEKN